MPTVKELEQLIQDLKTGPAKDFATISHHRGYWKEASTSLTQINKHFKALQEVGKVNKSGIYWNSPSYRGKNGIHDLLITKSIVDLHIHEINPIFKREISFDCGIRSDVAAILVRGNQARCIIVEVDLTETLEYLTGKYNQWMRWKDAHSALSKLFGYQVASFDFLSTSGRAGLKFDTFLEELR